MAGPPTGPVREPVGGPIVSAARAAGTQGLGSGLPYHFSISRAAMEMP